MPHDTPNLLNCVHSSDVITDRVSLKSFKITNNVNNSYHRGHSDEEMKFRLSFEER